MPQTPCSDPRVVVAGRVLQEGLIPDPGVGRPPVVLACRALLPTPVLALAVDHAEGEVADGGIVVRGRHGASVAFPTAVLCSPVVLAISAWRPTAVLLFAVLLRRACAPTAVLPTPVTLYCSGPGPERGVAVAGCGRVEALRRRRPYSKRRRYWRRARGSRGRCSTTRSSRGTTHPRAGRRTCSTARRRVEDRVTADLSAPRRAAVGVGAAPGCRWKSSASR